MDVGCNAAGDPLVPLRTLAVHVADASFEQLRDIQYGAAATDRSEQLLKWTRETLGLAGQLFACATCADAASAEHAAFTQIREAAAQGKLLADRSARAVDGVGVSQARLASGFASPSVDELRIADVPKPVFDVSSALRFCGNDAAPRASFLDALRSEGGSDPMRQSGFGGAAAAVFARVYAAAGSAAARAGLAKAVSDACADGSVTSLSRLNPGSSVWPLWSRVLASELKFRSRGAGRSYVRDSGSESSSLVPPTGFIAAERAARARITLKIFERLPRCVAAARHLLAQPAAVVTVRVDALSGHLVVQAPGEFKTALTLLGSGPKAQWVVIRVLLASQAEQGDSVLIDLTATASAAADQSRAVAMSLQHALFDNGASDCAERVAEEALPSYFDGVVATVYRFCHAAWSTLALTSCVEAARFFATRPMREAFPSSSLNRDTVSPLAVSWTSHFPRWRPGSVGCIYYAQSRSALVGQWHHATIPLADQELCNRIGRSSGGGACPVETCSYSTGFTCCVGRCSGWPFVPRYTLPSKRATQPTSGESVGEVICLGDTDPILTYLAARFGFASFPQRIVADDSMEIGGARCLTVIVDEWGGVQQLAFIADTGAPIASTLQAALTLHGPDVGPSELYAALRLAASSARFPAGHPVPHHSNINDASLNSSGGTVVRSTGQLVVVRDASGRARLEKPAVPENKRLGHRRWEATQEFPRHASTAAVPGSAVAPIPLQAAPAPVVHVGVNSHPQTCTGRTSFVLKAAAEVYSSRLCVPTRCAISAVKQSRGSLSPGLSACPDGPVARFAVASESPSPAELMAAFDQAGTGDVAQAVATEPLEIAICRVLSSSVLGSDTSSPGLRPAQVAQPLHPEQKNASAADAAASIAEADDDGLTAQIFEGEAPWEDSLASASSALCYRPSAPAYWAVDANRGTQRLPVTVPLPPVLASALGFICVGEVFCRKSPSAARAALDAASVKKDGENREQRSADVRAGLYVRALTCPWAQDTCPVSPRTLPGIWQCLALQQTRAIMRVTTAVIMARPDLHESVLGLGRMCLSPLRPGDSCFDPSFELGSASDRATQSENLGLQLCVDLPAVSEMAGFSLMLRAWLDPVTGGLQLDLSRSATHAASVPSSNSFATNFGAAMPLCAVLLECSHFTQQRFVDRISQIAYAIAASDRSTRAALRVSLKQKSRTLRLRAAGTQASSSRASVSTNSGARADATATPDVINQLLQRPVGRPGLLCPYAALTALCESSAAELGASAFDTMKQRIAEACQEPHAGAGGSGGLARVPELLLRATKAAARLGRGISAPLSQGRHTTVGAATAIAALHSAEVLALLGVAGNTPPEAVSALAQSMVNVQSSGMATAAGAPASSCAVAPWLCIPAFDCGAGASAAGAAAAGRLLREAQSYLGTPTPRDVAAVVLASDAREGAGIGGSAESRAAAVTASAANRIRHGTTAAVAAKLGAAAAVIIAEGFVRTACILEAAARANVALARTAMELFASSHLSSGAAATAAVQSRPRIIVLLPLAVFAWPSSKNDHAAATNAVADSVGRKRRRGAGADDEDPDNEKRLRRDSSNAAADDGERLPTEYVNDGAAAAELCSPRCGSVLRFPHPQPAVDSLVLIEGAGAILRPILHLSCALEPRWSRSIAPPGLSRSREGPPGASSLPARAAVTVSTAVVATAPLPLRAILVLDGPRAAADGDTGLCGLSALAGDVRMQVEVRFAGVTAVTSVGFGSAVASHASAEAAPLPPVPKAAPLPPVPAALPLPSSSADSCLVVCEVPPALVPLVDVRNALRFTLAAAAMPAPRAFTDWLASVMLQGGASGHAAAVVLLLPAGAAAPAAPVVLRGCRVPVALAWGRIAAQLQAASAGSTCAAAAVTGSLTLAPPPLSAAGAALAVQAVAVVRPSPSSAPCSWIAGGEGSLQKRAAAVFSIE